MLNKYSIRKKLLIAFILIEALTIPLFFLLIKNTYQIQNTFYTIIQESFPRNHALSQINKQAIEIRRTTENFSLIKGDSSQAEGTVASQKKYTLLAQLAELDSWQNKYVSYVTKQHQQLFLDIKTLDRLQEEIIIQSLKILELEERGESPSLIKESQEKLNSAQSKLAKLVMDSSVKESQYWSSQLERAHLKTNRLIVFFIIIFVIILFIFIMLSIYISARITKPIQELTKFTGSINVKNPDQNRLLISSDYEIGNLATVINTMLDSLCDNNLKLHYIHAHLKDLVAKKTIELQKVNKELEADVEKRTQAEKRISLLNQKLLKEKELIQYLLSMAEQSSKTKSLFLANMSHEIRTPLNGVLGMLQLMNHTPLTEKQKHFIENGTQCANNLLVIISDILDFSRIESGNLILEEKEIRLKDVFDSLMNTFKKPSQDKNLEMSLEYADEIPSPLMGDPERIKQVISNLLNNAIKFTPEGGKILIKADLESILNNKCTLRISVEDSGIGIPKSSQLKIFEFFVQADDSITRRYGGTGLGLAIAKQLVEKMDGYIEVHSHENKGSIFVFTIKLKMLGDSNSLKNEKKESTSTSTPNFPANILVVEDDRESQAVAKEMLGILGCSVDIAASSESALNAILEKKYDLIFIDCQMLAISGFQITQIIRQTEKDKNIIIALTGYNLDSEKKRCIDAGMDDYLHKPYVMKDLKAMLEKYLGHLRT